MQKESEYLQFINWIAKPYSAREPKTQIELAKLLEVEEATLSDWKKREGFWDLVRAEIKDWAKEKTAEVIDAVFKGATSQDSKGQSANAKLWLQYIEDWAEKKDISVYDPEKETRAKSLLDVYNNYDESDPQTKTTVRKARPRARANRRSAKATKAKGATTKHKTAKRSNKGAR
jgi:hypothetical protein